MFCSEGIKEGPVIETAPVKVMSADERKLLDQTLLHDYIFEWKPQDTQQCCMALGFVPVYNHSYSSNCEYFMNYEEQLISIKAVRDIPAHEELTINYNGDWNDTTPVWFDVHEG
jgi:hypothetical protein